MFKLESTKRLSRMLTELEQKYGANLKGVKRNKVSPLDPRTSQQVSTGGMSGGDRFSNKGHGFQDYYADYFEDMLDKDRVVLAEVGILRGTGIAIWSEIFENSRILGFDIDLSHTKKNLENLSNLGAKTSNIELHEMDQFINNRQMIEDILAGDKLDIVIDDGFHNRETVINTIESVKDFLSEDFVYVVEDVNESQFLKEKYSEWKVALCDCPNGHLTMITPRKKGE